MLRIVENKTCEKKKIKINKSKLNRKKKKEKKAIFFFGYNDA